MSIAREQLEAWLKKIDVDTKAVLDVGGSQLPIINRVNSFKVEDYKILDLKNPHEKNCGVDIVCDLSSSSVHEISSASHGQKFDVVFCIEVMEYIHDPFSAIYNLVNLTKSYGTLYISFPFIYPVHNPAGKDFLRYTPEGAEFLLKKAGFKIVEHCLRRGDANIKRLFDRYGMKARKKIDHSIIGSLIKAKKSF